MEGNADGYFVEPVDANAPTSTPAPAGEAAACPAGTAPEPQLVVGMQGHTSSNTTPSRLRSSPSASADQVGQIEPAEIFVVLDGPVCADGYNWWQVDVNGTEGWTAEGDASGYFVELIPATATPTMTRTPLPTSTALPTRTPGPTLTPSITPTASDTPTPTAVPLLSPANVTWSSDGKWLAVANASEALLYDSSNLDVPVRVLVEDALSDILFNPAVPNELAVATEESVYLYNIDADKKISEFVNTNRGFQSLSFSADGKKLLALGRFDDHFYVFDVEAGSISQEGQQYGPPVEPPPADAQTGNEETVYVPAVAALSPDGRFAALVTDDPRRIIIFPLDGSDAFNLPLGDKTNSMLALTFSPDSTKLVAGDVDGNIQLWDIATQKRIAAFIRAEDDDSQSRSVEALAFSPDGSVIASAESQPQGIIRIFLSADLKQSTTFGVHTADTRTTDVAFSPDGKYLAYAADNTVRILETQTYTQVAALIRAH